jgi:creatinine amidohydrolase
MMTSPEAAALRPGAAVLPVGSFEQHGDHLPLATDTLVASAVASGVADHYGLLLLPPVTISCSHEHAAWPGTVSISAVTLAAIVGDIRRSLLRSGIKQLVIVNGHGGNYVLSNIVQEANADGPSVTLFPGRADWDAARRYAHLRSSSHDDMHAGELETSLLLHRFPEAVRSGYESADVTASERPFLLVHGISAYTATGVIGYPSHASAEKGEAVLDSLVASFAGHLQALATNPQTAPNVAG